MKEKKNAVPGILHVHSWNSAWLTKVFYCSFALLSYDDTNGSLNKLEKHRRFASNGADENVDDNPACYPQSAQARFLDAGMASFLVLAFS